MPKMVIKMVADAGQRTLFRLAYKHIEPGGRIDTNSWRGYNLLGQVYDHRSVKHSASYVQDGVHCNTPEAEWSIFRHWWATFRGVAKRYIHLYLAQYEYQRSRREWSALERLEEMIGFLFALLQHGLLRLAAVQIPPVRLDLCATLDERS